MSVWVCKNCNYTFSRIQEPEQCPDCGKLYIVQATEEEEAAFQKSLEEVKKEKW